MNGSITIRLPQLGFAEEQDSGVASAVATTALSDEMLIAEICLGNREALALPFRRYPRVVRGVALRVLKDTAEADDILQDRRITLGLRTADQGVVFAIPGPRESGG